MNFFPNWAKNILFLLVFMLSGLVLIIVIEGLISGTELLPFNTLIERGVVQVRTPFLTTLLVVLTHIGSPFLLSFLACVIAVIIFLRGDVYNAILIVATMVVALISLAILRDTFQVARPTGGLMSVEGWSFPSGHATVATAFFFSMAHAFFRKVKSATGKIVLVATSILLPALVSFSRLYLGAHWALDILGGVALGILSVSFTVLMFNILVNNDRWRTRLARVRIPKN